MDRIGYRTNRIRIAGRVIVLAAAFLLLSMLVVPSINAGWFWEDADSDKVVKFLQDHSNWLQRSDDGISVAIRTIAWMIITGLYKLSSFFEGMMNHAVSLLSWTESSGLGALLDGLISKALNGLVWILLAISVILVGIKVIVQKEQPNFKGYAANFMISVILIIGMPQLIGTLNTMATAFFNDALSAGESAYTEEAKGDERSKPVNLSWSTVSQNIADLVYVGKTNFDLIANDSAPGEKKHSLTSDRFFSLDLSSVLTGKAIDEAEVPSTEFEYLRYAVSDDGMGNATAYKMDTWSFSGMITGSGSSAGYFRYPMHFWTIFFTLLTLCIAYVFTAFCMVKAVFEIGIKNIYGVLVFATDIETGERTKMVVKDILVSYAALGFYAINFQIFSIFVAYLTAKTGISDVFRVIAFIAATCAMIGGSTTVMKYFGVQTGFGQQIRNLVGGIQTGASMAFYAGMGKRGKGTGGGVTGGGGDGGPGPGDGVIGGGPGGGPDPGGVKKSVGGASGGGGGASGKVIDMNSATGQKSFKNFASAAEKGPYYNAENSANGNSNGEAQSENQNGDKSDGSAFGSVIKANTGADGAGRNKSGNMKDGHSNQSAGNGTGANSGKKDVGSSGTANAAGMSFGNDVNAGSGETPKATDEGLHGGEKKSIDDKKDADGQAMEAVNNSAAAKTDAAQNSKKPAIDLANFGSHGINKGVGTSGNDNKNASGDIGSAHGKPAKGDINQNNGLGTANTFAQSGEVNNSAQPQRHVGDRGNEAGSEYTAPQVSNSGAENISSGSPPSGSAPAAQGFNNSGSDANVSGSATGGTVERSVGTGKASGSSEPVQSGDRIVQFPRSGSQASQTPITPNESAVNSRYERMGLYDGLDSIRYKSEKSTEFSEKSKGDDV